MFGNDSPDSSSFSDEKITELFMEHGYEGIGLFYTILERLALQEMPIKTEVLKAQLRVGKKLNRCWNFMETLGLISSNNDETFNERLLQYSKSYEVKKEKNRIRIERFRENSEQKAKRAEDVTHYAENSNTSKVKRIKKNEEEKESTYSSESYFNTVWKLYPNRQGKKESFRHYISTVKSENDFKNITIALQNYLTSARVKNGYIKNGSTWFNEWQEWIEPTEHMIGKQNGTTNIINKQSAATTRATFKHTDEQIKDNIDLAESLRIRLEQRS